MSEKIFEHPKINWISVKKELPPLEEEILLVNKTVCGIELWTGCYRNNCDYDEDADETIIGFWPCPSVGYGERCPFPFEEITHWSPIPELPD